MSDNSRSDNSEIMQAARALREKKALEAEIRQAAAEYKKNLVSPGEALAQGALQGVTFNLSDEIGGGWDAIKGILDEKTSFKDRYTKSRDESRDKIKRAFDQHPKTYLTGEIGSSLLIPIPGLSALKTAKAAGKVASKASKASLGKKAGKTLSKYKADIGAGALSGYGGSEGSEISETLLGGATGGLAGAAIGKVANKISDTGGKESLIKALAKITPSDSDLAERMIKNYLKNPEKVNSGPERLDIIDNADLVHKLLKDKSTSKKDALESLKSKISDDIKISNKNYSDKISDAKESLRKTEKDIDHLETPDVTGKVVSAVRKAKQHGINISRNARAKLNAEEPFDTQELLAQVSDPLDSLRVDGKPPFLKEAKIEWDKLIELKNSLKKRSISSRGAHDLRKQLDYQGAGPGMHEASAAAFSPDEATKARKAMRRSISKKLKENPEYKKAMDEASPIFAVNSYLDKKKILPKDYDPENLDSEKLMNFISGIGKPEKAGRVRKVLGALEKNSGNNILPDLENYAGAKLYKKTGKLPEYPDDNPILQKLLQSKLSLDSLSKEKRAPQINNLLAGKSDDIDFVKKFGTGDIKEDIAGHAKESGSLDALTDRLSKVPGPNSTESLVRRHLKTNPLEPRYKDQRTLDTLSDEFQKLTGNKFDFRQALDNRQNFEFFTKSKANGSRLTLLFKSLGEMIFPNRFGSGVGAATGYVIDTESGTILKGLLNKAINSRDSRKQFADASYKALKFIDSHPTLKYTAGLALKKARPKNANLPHALTRLINKGHRDENEKSP